MFPNFFKRNVEINYLVGCTYAISTSSYALPSVTGARQYKHDVIVCTFLAAATTVFSVSSPHIRESRTVLDAGIQATDSGSQVMDTGFFVSGTWILDSNRQWDPDFWICIPNSKAQDSRFHENKFPDSKFRTPLIWTRQHCNYCGLPLFDQSFPQSDILIFCPLILISLLVRHLPHVKGQ